MSRKILVNLDLNKNQLLNAAIQSLPTDPSSPVVGQIYFNSNSKVLKIYNGYSWIILKDTLNTSDIAGLDFNLSDIQNNITSTKNNLENRITQEVATLTSSIEEKTSAIAQGLNISTVSGLNERLTSIDSTASSNKQELKQEISEKKSALEQAIATEGSRVENLLNTKETSIREEITNKVAQVKREILGAASQNWDTLKEIEDNVQRIVSGSSDALVGLTKKYVTEIGDGVAVEHEITHNLNSRDVVVTIRTSNAPYEAVVADIEFTTENTLKVKTARPISASEKLTVVVVG